MISAPDRRQAVELIEAACQAGARQARAAAELGLSVRTFQRWKEDPDQVRVDGRPTATRPQPAHQLSAQEREVIIATCNAPEYNSLPPSQIVPRLADQGIYLGSESTFYRVLREQDLQHHRGRSQAPKAARPRASHQATGPCQVWSWDISWLPGPVRGSFFYLYLILDVWSRKIVGWEILPEENAEHAATVVQHAVWAEHCLNTPLVLHADNGSPMKGSTLLAMLQALGIQPSYSRPSVSNDNPFSEALFRTCKYRPTYPTHGFHTLQAARAWVFDFVRWYNTEHRHSAIRFVTPQQRHEGQDLEILAKRHELYQRSRAANPARWARHTRNWNPIGPVWLNPVNHLKPAQPHQLPRK